MRATTNRVLSGSMSSFFASQRYVMAHGAPGAHACLPNHLPTDKTKDKTAGSKPPKAQNSHKDVAGQLARFGKLVSNGSVQNFGLGLGAIFYEC